MGNPIQYHNTDNPSKIGGLATTVEGFVTTTYHCETPQGLSQWESHCGMTPGGTTMGGGSLMKTLHRPHSTLPEDEGKTG